MNYFLYGENPLLQIKTNELIDKIKSKNKNIEIKFYDGGQDEDLEKFYQTISSVSMFNPSQLLFFKRIEKLKKISDLFNTIKKYQTAEKEILLSYEEIMNDFGKPEKTPTDKDLSIIKEIFEIFHYKKETQQKDLKLLIQQNLNISKGEAESLIEIIGDDYFTVINEIDKIQKFLDGNTYSQEKIKDIITINNEYNIKSLIQEFLLKKTSNNLITFLQQSKEYLNFLYIISEELIMCLKMNALNSATRATKNMSYDNFTKIAFEKCKNIFIKKDGRPMHPYAVYTKLNYINIIDTKKIIEKLKDILMIEYKIKTGDIPDNIAIESFILKFWND